LKRERSIALWAKDLPSMVMSMDTSGFVCFAALFLHVIFTDEYAWSEGK
jgi:hypothetical protein